MERRKNFLWISLILCIIIVGVLIGLFFWPKKEPAKEFAAALDRLGIARSNILVITLDTTRADHLGCYGYSLVKTPNLDALAKQSVLFEQCSASSPLTLPSHCSIMTGLYPTFHGVRVNGNTALSEDHLTLAEILAQKGYQCGAFIGAFVLDGRWGLKQGFHYYDDQFNLQKYKQLDLGLVQRPGNEVVDAALSWLETKKESPFFAWVHLYDPHTPYTPPEPYLSEYNNRGIIGLYDGEIAFMDKQVGRLISWLGERGLDKKTIIAVIGDHGEGLGDHGEQTHGYFIYDGAIQVPFLIAIPLENLQGRRVFSQVRTVDLYPTLLEMAGIEIPQENQGDSLLPLMFRPEAPQNSYAYSESYTPNILYGWSALHSLRTTRYKYIDAPRAELYDLTSDPTESQNIKQEFPKIAADLKKMLDELIRRTSLNAPAAENANIDKETLQRLAALGYIGAQVSRKSSQGKGRELIDPKDKLHIYDSIQQAGELLNGEKYAEAASFLERVLREEPSIPQALLLLGTCYTELGRKEEARAQYDLILKEDPNSIQALIGLANLLLQEGKNEDVIALCKQALAQDDKNTQAYTLIGEIYMGEKDHAQALPYLEKAVAIQPKITQSQMNLAACLVGLRRYAEAETILKEILVKYPKFPLAYYHLGLLYEEQGKLEEAQEAYAKEIALYPDHFRARFNLGKILYKLGDREEYNKEMREVIRIAPNAPEGYLFLARGLLNESADLNEIEGMVEKGLSLAKTSELKALGYFLLADIYTRKNQPDKVREALSRANYYKKSE